MYDTSDPVLWSIQTRQGEVHRLPGNNRRENGILDAQYEPGIVSCQSLPSALTLVQTISNEMAGYGEHVESTKMHTHSHNYRSRFRSIRRQDRRALPVSSTVAGDVRGNIWSIFGWWVYLWIPLGQKFQVFLPVSHLAQWCFSWPAMENSVLPPNGTFI